MKKYNITVYGTFGSDEITIESNAKNKLDKTLIKILVELGDSIDPQGSSGGDYDTAICKIKKLFTK